MERCLPYNQYSIIIYIQAVGFHLVTVKEPLDVTKKKTVVHIRCQKIKNIYYYYSKIAQPKCYNSIQAYKQVYIYIH